MNYRLFDASGQPTYQAWEPGMDIPPGFSILPFFPGYKFERGISTYRGEEVGEGGYVYAEPGMHYHVALLDIASMHPSSIIAEELFGEIFTRRFAEIVQARIAIKHKDYDRARQMLGGKLAKYLDDPEACANLAQALKIAINSVYGLTSAKFTNPFRDERNRDNIVAKRGALFMINLKHEVQARGFTVAHIKTDSIKIPDATPEIIRFVMDYGREYGYNFEHEATYDRMCLVNNAVYIARYASPDWCQNAYGYLPSDIKKHPNMDWTATGKEFQVPYVFKTLFSGEPIEFSDLTVTQETKSALYLDNNEGKPEGEHDYAFVGKVGLFCPVRERCGGGLLMREAINNKTGEKTWAAATGTKGYRWMEAERVQTCGLEEAIDLGYFRKLVDDAIENMAQFGDVESFRKGECA